MIHYCAVLSAFVLALNVNHVSAANCPPHGTTTTYTYVAASRTDKHYISTGYISNGKEVYETCWITTEYINHDLYCTVCNAKLNTSYSTRESHTHYKC